MSETTVKRLKHAIHLHWPGPPSNKARHYVGKFFNPTRTERKIAAQVQGNHGIYTVSILVNGQLVTSACSCYIGKHGGCHHCAALAATFLKDASVFKKVKSTKLEEVLDLTGLCEYLKGTTLEALLKELRARGVTQKAVAESIGMNPRHLTSIKSSELRNRYYNELGATKLACLWILEHLTEVQSE